MNIPILPLLTDVALAVFLWSVNIGQGARHTLAEILAPFRRWRVVVPAIGLNIVLVPLLYYALTLVFQMPPDLATGFMFVGFASAAPFAIQAAAIEKGNVPLAIALVVLLGALNVVVVPLWAALLLPEVERIDASQTAWTLVLLVLLPLAIGLLLRTRFPQLAARVTPVLQRITLPALAAVIVLMVIISLRGAAVLFSSWVIPAGLIALAISMALGYLVGRDVSSRRVVSVVTGMRSIGVALAIVAISFPGNAAVSAAAIALAIIALAPLGIAYFWGRRSGP